MFLKEWKCFVQTHSQVSIHSQVLGALKICHLAWTSFLFLLDRTCCLLFYLNWKIMQAKRCVVDGTAVPTALVLAVQLFCTGQFSTCGVSSLWSRQAQKWVNCSSSSGHRLQISSAQLEVHLLCTVTRFSFTKWALSVKLMPCLTYPESVTSLLIMSGRTNLPKEIKSLPKKLEAQSKTRLLTKFLLFPRETLCFALPNVVDHWVGDIRPFFFIVVSLIQPY